MGKDLNEGSSVKLHIIVVKLFYRLRRAPKACITPTLWSCTLL